MEKPLDFRNIGEYTSKIGLKINLYPEVLLLLKRGYLELKGKYITLEDQGGEHRLFKISKHKHYLQVLDSDKGTYSTYYPRCYNRHKLLEIKGNGEKDGGSMIFLSNQYPAIKNGHTNITILTTEGDHKETTDINFSKKNPSLFHYVETLFTGSAGVIAGQVYSGHEGGTGITEGIGFLYPNKTVATHLKTDAFIDALLQKTPEKKFTYNAFSSSIFHGYNCTRYAMHALANVGVMLDKMVGADRLTFSPGQLGHKIEKFFTKSHTDLAFDVYIKDPKGEPVNTKPIQFFKGKAGDDTVMFYVKGGDTKDKLIRLDENNVINPNLNYVLWKIYNNESQQQGNTYTITADPVLDMKHAVPLLSKKPIKPSFFLEFGSSKIYADTVKCYAPVDNNMQLH